jgi:hypothetical protein
MCQYVNYVGMVVEVCGIIEIGFTLHLKKKVRRIQLIELNLKPQNFTLMTTSYLVKYMKTTGHF